MSVLYTIKQLKIFRVVICSARILHYFFLLRSHVSKRMGMSVDSNGDYVPWLTYPVIDYLDNLDFSDCNVFEYGSGASSFWWARRARQVTSIEMDAEWCSKISGVVPENVEIISQPDGGQYPGMILDQKQDFDVIVVDGAERFKCVVNAMLKLSKRGIIILDNSDWYLNAAKLLCENGFVQVDFYGHSPNNSFPSKTSLFFRSAELLANRVPCARNVIGGVQIKGGVLDDS